MVKLQTNYRLILFALIITLFYGCSPPPVENVYRKECRFPSSINVPVALLVAEWGGKPRVMGSAWLIDGGRGALFTAKHVTDALMNSTIELGANECKLFLNGNVYSCIVVQVPPLRDSVVLKMLGPFEPAELPKPYKISTTKLKLGDKVFIQGFHPHSSEITKSNLADGLKDLIVPIFKTFYELRTVDPSRQKEIVFDNLEATVVKTNEHVKIDHQESDPAERIKFQTNEYVKVVTVRNHKFSFGGLSGGVVVRINDQGTAEAVGIVTAEEPEKLKYDKKGQLEVKLIPKISNILFITPIYSVKDLYDYARQVR